MAEEPAGADPGSHADRSAEEAPGKSPVVAPEEVRLMRRAIRQIQREGWKVAVIYAVVDAALATLLVNLLVTVLSPAALPEFVGPPAAVSGYLAAYPTVAGATIPTSALLGVAVGLAVLVAEVGLRVRRPLVEQFEAANAELRESLRTARDALAEDASTRMARRLYGSVLADLRRASSVGLVDLRRLSGTVVLLLVVSVATIHLATVDLAILGGVEGGGDPSGEDPGSTYGGLQDPSSVLGEPEDVPTGVRSDEVDVGTDGEGSGDGGGSDPSAAYDSSGFADPSAVERQRAEFAESERLEDAELIREYNVRIREDG